MVSGTGLSGATAVHFGAVAASSFTVVSATSATAVVPAGSGTVDVTVTTPGGTSALSSADKFTYSVATVSIAPVGLFWDRAANGTASLPVSPVQVGDALVMVVKISSSTVTVSSVSGGGASWVKVEAFAGTSGKDVELWLGSVTTPGSQTVSVTYSGSVSSDDVELAAQEFTAGLGAATVWSKDSAGGQLNSSVAAFPSLTAATSGELYFGYIRGSGTFSGSSPGWTYVGTSDGNEVTFDPAVSGVVAPPVSQVPAGASTSAAVLVAASGGVSSTPTVSAVSPTSGSAGATVTLTGTNFTGATAVHFGAVAASSFTVVSATSATAVVPAGSGTVDVTVTTPGGTSALSSADQFTYTASSTPTVSGVSPTSGSAGATVTLTGTNFTGATAVHFGAVAASSFTVVSATSATAVVPAGSGTVDVTVTTPGGTSALSSADQFTYTASSTPTVSGVSPTSGPRPGRR